MATFFTKPKPMPRLPLIPATVACTIAIMALLVTGPTKAQVAVPTDAAATNTVYLPLIVNPSSAQNPTEQEIADEVLKLVNQERAKVGCIPLSLESHLMSAAQSHTEDMAFRNYFSHTGSDGSSSAERATRAGYIWSYVGENIAAGYTTPVTVMQGWMNSPGHRANILNCEYTHIGIGYFYEANDQPIPGQSWAFYHYWTQALGSP